MRPAAIRCVVMLAAMLTILAPAPKGAGAWQSAAGAEPSAGAAVDESLVIRVQELERQLKFVQAALAGRAAPPRQVLPSEPLTLAESRFKGSRRAKVGIIEFADFQCPFCAAFARDVLPALEQRYVDTGLVRIGFWNLPLVEIHPRALRAAMTAECASRQNRFWPVHDRLFATDASVDQIATPPLAQGLSTSELTACMSGGDGEPTVRAELARARALGFATTPTFVIGTFQADGSLLPKELIVGARPLSAFSTIIDTLLVSLAQEPHRP